MANQVKAAIFDLGATLLSVPPALEEEDRIADLFNAPYHAVDFLSQQICLTRPGMDTHTFVESLVGALKSRWSSSLKLPDLLDAAHEIVDKSIKGSHLHSDVNPAMQLLKRRGIKLCLISNTNPVSRDRIDYHNIAHWFDEIIFSCDVQLSKPDPRIFELAFSKFNLEASHFCAIGDKVRTMVLGISHLGVRTILVERRARSIVQSERLTVKAIVPDLLALCTLRDLGGDGEL